MHVKSTINSIRRSPAREDGFTMIFVIAALLVSGILVAAAFAAADGDFALSRKSTSQTAAYYAATAGVQRYEYELSRNPNFWIECPSITVRKVPGQPEQEYKVSTLPAASYAKCEKGVQASVIETSGAARGTFRILIEGTSGKGANKTTHKIVATFTHPGFTKYVYETNYEVEDPSNFSPEPTNCEHYYKERVEKKLTSTCGAIEFAPEDKVNGPMHTNDAADLCAEGSNKPTFGREKREDAIEMLGGYYGGGGTCKAEAKFNGKYTTEAESLLPPETDAELLESASYKFSGRTVIVLKSGSPNTMTVTNKGTTTTKEFPQNGVVYVENSSEGCSVTKYSPFDSDTVHDTGCGDVYVSGTYTESLTIASADDVIVDGNITTSHESSGEPTGGAELGLIAENFVRVYHPVAETYEVEHYTPKTITPTGTECLNEVTETGKITSGKKTITGLTTTSGFTTTGTTKVSGTGIPSGATVTKIVTTNSSIEISSNATKTENVSITFKVPASGYSYYSGIKKCVETAKSGYTFHETELIDAKACSTFEKAVESYASGGECEYTNTSKGCDAPNENASEDPNKWGSLESPTIDAAILSTKHSWIVDNYKCGEKLGELNVWGSIAQFWRGPVGTGGGSGTGYIKNYNYDQRLFTKEPPNFLSPVSTSWKLSRESEAG